MELINMADTFYQQLTAQRTDILDSNESFLQKQQQIVRAAELVLAEINNHLISGEFKHKEEEITFFKSKLPPIYAIYLYHTYVYQIESAKPIGTKGSVRKYYYVELKKIEYYTQNNIDFYKYWRKKSSQLDEIYFLRRIQESESASETLSPFIDRRVCTVYSLKVAELLAYEALRDYLNKVMAKAKQPEANSGELPTLNWTDTKAGLIELIYAFHEKGCFNNGKTTIKQITEFFERSFNVTLGNTSRSFQVILSRKIDYSAYIDKLKRSFLQRIEKIEDQNMHG